MSSVAGAIAKPVDQAIADHVAAADPHGDRAYADGIVSAEATTRAAADIVLSDAITAESDARSAGDASLGTSISGVQSSLVMHAAETSNVHGIADTSVLVTLAGVQTLTNKTLTAPAITAPSVITIASSSVVGQRIVGASGQTADLWQADAFGGSGGNRARLAANGAFTCAGDIVSSAGGLALAGGIQQGSSGTIYWLSRARISSPSPSTSDGRLLLQNANANDFNLLIAGVATSSGAAWKRNGTGWKARNGDDTADTDVMARLFQTASFTVATLPTAGTAARIAYASDGRKNGEGVGAGTGVLVFDDGTAWRACDTGATVAA